MPESFVEKELERVKARGLDTKISMRKYLIFNDMRSALNYSFISGVSLVQTIKSRSKGVKRKFNN